MTEMIYLDYNASQPLLREAKTAMTEAFDLVGNGSSVHGAGRLVRSAIEKAREQVATTVGAKPQDVIFTSGGTEANNLALTPSLFKKPLQSGAQLFVSAIEHPAVLNGMRFNQEQINIIPVTKAGVVDVQKLKAALEEIRSRLAVDEGQEESLAVLVSVMAANNETGIVQPLREIADIVHEMGGLVHSDCVQALGKMPISIDELGVDLMSVSAHKIGGPQGVGALILKDSSVVLRDPLIAGGGQELKRRGGTENVIGIVGFGAAAQTINEDHFDKLVEITTLRDKLEAGILEISPEAVIFGKGQARLGNCCCFAVEGFSAETLVIQMDLNGVAVSSGSACSSGKVEQSLVLKAMAVPESLGRGALRISLGVETSVQEIDRFIEVWEMLYQRQKRGGMATDDKKTSRAKYVTI